MAGVTGAAGITGEAGTSGIAAVAGADGVAGISGVTGTLVSRVWLLSRLPLVSQVRPGPARVVVVTRIIGSSRAAGIAGVTAGGAELGVTVLASGQGWGMAGSLVFFLDSCFPAAE